MDFLPFLGSKPLKIMLNDSLLEESLNPTWL